MAREHSSGRRLQSAARSEGAMMRDVQGCWIMVKTGTVLPVAQETCPGNAKCFVQKNGTQNHWLLDSIATSKPEPLALRLDGQFDVGMIPAARPGERFAVLGKAIHEAAVAQKKLVVLYSHEAVEPGFLAGAVVAEGGSG